MRPDAAGSPRGRAAPTAILKGIRPGAPLRETTARESIASVPCRPAQTNGFEGPRGEPAASGLPVGLSGHAVSPGDGTASRRRPSPRAHIRLFLEQDCGCARGAERWPGGSSEAGPPRADEGGWPGAGAAGSACTGRYGFLRDSAGDRRKSNNPNRNPRDLVRTGDLLSFANPRDLLFLAVSKVVKPSSPRVNVAHVLRYFQSVFIRNC